MSTSALENAPVDASLEPPFSKRGVNRVSVDWLAFTLKGATVDAVLRSVETYLGEPLLDAVGGGVPGYTHHRVGASGARLCWSESADMERREAMGVHVVLPGKACASLDEDSMRGLLLWATTIGHATRCDLALDDWERTVEPRAVMGAWEHGEAVTHARSWRFIQSDSGDTFYVGKRGAKNGGLQLLRVYDKGAESGGAIDAIRYELETHGEVAQFMASALVRRNWGEVWAERVVSYVDFRIGGKRSPWFRRLVGEARRASAYAPVALRGMLETMAWLEGGVSAMLATVFEAVGGDMSFVQRLLAVGQERRTERHRQLLTFWSGAA